MNGAKLLLKCLKKHGVDTIFGYPGGSVIPLYDALYGEDGFNHIRTAHEQGASHAADGYSRSTGKVGVCFVTSGPGATNIVTGLATAYMDSIPMIAITGQVASNLLGKDAFQEIDITGITFSVTKHNYLVRNVADIPKIVDEAFNIATSGRRGPVLIDIPKDIFQEILPDDFEVGENEINKDEISINKNEVNIDEYKMKEIVNAINESKKPIIYAGGGSKCIKDSNLLTRFAEKIDAPVFSTIMGLGVVNRNHPLSLGMLGMHGFKENNVAVASSDLLIGIGARFSDRVIGDPLSFAKNSRVIHIDVDLSEIDKNIESEISIVGDITSILEKITDKVEKKDSSIWKREIESFKEPLNINKSDFHPVNIIERLNKKFSENTFVATDVGQHQMWTAQNWKFDFKESFITSGGLGTMGFGLGSAIGAACGNKDKRVILVTGDGSFRMNCNEMFTLRRYNIPVVIVLFNNSALGMVRQWQRMFFNERFSETDIDSFIDYVELSKGFGINAYSAETIDELEEILKNDEAFNGPVLIECKISKDENILPIVPPGKAIENPIMDW